MRTAQAFTACDAYAAHKATGKASAQCDRILSFIEARGGDWSIGEVAQALVLEKSTVSARMNELLATGELEAKQNRKDRVSGITVRPVGLPVLGQMELIA
jgi:predicted transcriptional regulator